MQLFVARMNFFFFYMNRRAYALVIYRSFYKNSFIYRSSKLNIVELGLELGPAGFKVTHSTD